jgi:glucose/arabinose dehydrogenase
MRSFLILTVAVLLMACQETSPVKYSDQRVIPSAYYRLQATHHMFVNTGGMGGGIAAIDDQWLVVRGDGTFRLFTRLKSGKDFRIRNLPYKAPLNRDLFAETAPAETRNDSQQVEKFRVADVVVRKSGKNLQLWVSHHWWNEEEGCVTLRVSTAEVDAESFLDGALTDVGWSTLFDATPCLSVKHFGFSGHLDGGKMTLEGSAPHTMYLTVGDHGISMKQSVEPIAQDKQTAWGKTVRIDLATGNSTIYTLGHRNPQGIFLDDTGNLWQTEHGIRGGDELNLLTEGKNYGWPLVTYGTDYDTYSSWPNSENAQRHEGFEQPVHAWIPSIGISDVIRLQGDLFPLWKGDLIVGSLRGQSIYRIHIREGRAVVVEPIVISKRIRDIAEGPGGEIVLWTDQYRMIFIEPAPEAEFP